MRKFIMGLWAGLAAMALWVPASWAAEEKVPLDKLPKAVTAAVKAKFPDAELKGGEKDEADGKTIYEVSLKSKGHDYDVSLTPEGKIIEIEKTIAAKDLPAAVVRGLDQKYPKATIKLAEEISKDNTTNYEVIIETADKKKLEVVLDASGKIVKEEVKGEAKEDSDDDEEVEDEDEEEERIALDKLPKAVREAFRTKFPGVSKVEWKLKPDKNYEAEFNQKKGVEVAVKFDDKGKWLETETAIERSALPNAVLATISKEYKAYDIIETQKVERTGDKPILFEVHLENGEEILKVQFEKSGAIASKSSKRISGP